MTSTDVTLVYVGEKHIENRRDRYQMDFVNVGVRDMYILDPWTLVDSPLPGIY